MDLKNIPTDELAEKIELYKELKSTGVRDEIMLSKLEQEMERRFLAWEAAEV